MAYDSLSALQIHISKFLTRKQSKENNILFNIGLGLVAMQEL